jgi:HlyD family secretion protein
MGKLITRLAAISLGIVIGIKMIGPSTPDIIVEPYDSTKQIIATTAIMDRLNPSIELPATLKAASEVQLFSEVGGKITAIHVTEGHSVSGEQVLITIDQDHTTGTLDSQYQQTLINLNASQNSVSNLYETLAEEIDSVELQIADLEDAIRYAENSHTLTDINNEATLSIYEAQLETAQTSLDVAEETLENTIDQMDLNIETSLEDAANGVLTIYNDLDVIIKHVDELLGIDDPNVDTRYRDYLDTNNHHIYLFRSDDAYRDARDSHESIDATVNNVDSTDEDSIIEALDALEDTINETLFLLEKMEELLDFQINRDDYLAYFEAFQDQYDTDQSSTTGYLSTIQNYQQAVDSAQLTADISVEDAEANLEIAEDNYDAALANLEGAETSGNQQSNSTSSSVTSLKNQRNSAYQNLNMLQQQYSQQIEQSSYDVQLKETLAAQALTQIQSGEVLSPTSGVFANLDVEVGEVISAGTPLASVVNTDYFQVEFFVSEFEIPSIEVGTTIEISLAAYPDTPFTGWIWMIAPTADSGTKTFKVKAYLNDPRGRNIVSGMSADVLIDLDPNSKETVIIPVDAILTHSNRHYVYVIRDEVAYEQTVNVGTIVENSIEILNGLEAGDVISIQGQNLLNSGNPVEIVRWITIDELSE